METSYLLNMAKKIDSKRREAIKIHLNNKLGKFCEEFQKLSLENDHPWITIYLDGALWELKATIAKQRYYIADEAELTF